MSERNNQIEITIATCNKATDSVLASGPYYMVPLHKYEYYENGKPQMVDVPLEQALYLNNFITGENGKPQMGVDVEHILPIVIERGALGLDNNNLKNMEEGLVALATIPERMLANNEVLQLINRNLSTKDKDFLEISQYNPNGVYLTPASIVRADLLLNNGSRVFSCDPNLVPLGYAISARLSENIQKETGLPVGPTNDYMQGIAEMAQQYPNKINGIVTTLNYPNWSSHQALAEIVREKTGANFYVIPIDCVKEDGTLDINALNKFNIAFDIPQINSNDFSNVPGFLIRHVREKLNYHQQTKVVGGPGIRMIETQLWGGLLALPGFENIANKQGVSNIEIQKALAVNVPTLIARVQAGELQFANAITEEDSGLNFNWITVDSKQNLEMFLGPLYTINCQEKPSELSWFIKTLSTSGKKGVKFTNDGRIDQTPANILKIVSKMQLEDGGIFLIQPKVRSVIKNTDNTEIRTKVDLFLSIHTGKTVLIEYMATPIEQRSAHGSAATKLGLVLR